MSKEIARNILIVDDEEHVCSVLQRCLRRPSFNIQTCTDPRKALELMKTLQFDLVISDHLMPHMSGLQFLKMVRDRHPDCIRIIMTGHLDMQTAIDAINHADIFRFMTKPWDNMELKVTLHLAFEKLDQDRENRQLLALSRQMSRLGFLNDAGSLVTELARDVSGAILIDESETLSLDSH